MDRFGTILLRELLGPFCLCLTTKALGEPVGRVTRFHPNRAVPFVMTDLFLPTKLASNPLAQSYLPGPEARV
jgi:hypothetical protein